MKHQRSTRILITNDDGIDAPGIAILIEIAKEFSSEIFIVAPEHDKSGSGQSLSLHHPLRCVVRGPNRWAVAGTPADCVGLAVSHLMEKSPPTLILSGINAGSNTGFDVNISGTLGAAFMGLMVGIPAIALSLDCIKRKDAKWETARAIAPYLLRHFIEERWPENTCLSINIPDRPADAISGFSWARQAVRTTSHVKIDKRTDLRDETYYWLSLRDQETSPTSTTDQAILATGDVAVTALSLDRSISYAPSRVAFKVPHLFAVNE